MYDLDDYDSDYEYASCSETASDSATRDDAHDVDMDVCADDVDAMRYAEMFEAPDAEIRSLFPNDFEDESALPQGAADIGAIFADHLAQLAGTRTASPPNADPDQPTHCTDETGTVKLKDSPATRFMAHSVGIVFPVRRDFCRKDVLQQLAADERVRHLFPPGEVYVGYVLKEATGFAVALLTEEAHRELFLAVVEGARPSTDSDIRMFQREERLRAAVPEKQPLPTTQPGRSISKGLQRRMHDVGELRKAIEQRGGLRGCKFVAMDMEAAVVLENSIPLPLEISFVPVGCDDNDRCHYHFLVHPGKVHDEYTAIKLSVGELNTAHCLPFRNYTFLSAAYHRQAQSMQEILLDTPNVILINKGSISDYRAIQIIYCAARELYADHAIPPVPTDDDIPMFDIAALRGVLGKEQDVGTEWKAFRESKRGQDYCWYHRSVHEQLNCHLHCARDDAHFLASAVLDLLNDF